MTMPARPGDDTVHRMPRPLATAATAATADPRAVSGAAIERALARFEEVARRAGQAHGLRGDDLDEVLQGVRIRLWRASETPGKLDALSASYVYRAALSAAVDLLRRRRVRREEPGHEEQWRGGGIAAPSPGADETLVSGETLEAIARALDALPPNRRAVVRMYLTGYGRDEISALLQWSEAKTRNLLYRGLDDLRQRLIALGIRPGGTS